MHQPLDIVALLSQARAIAQADVADACALENELRMRTRIWRSDFLSKKILSQNALR